MNVTVELREYLKVRLGGGVSTVIDELSTARMKELVETLYEGGYDQWSRDYLGRPGRAPNADTSITRKARLRDLLGTVQFGGREILHIKEQDDQIIVFMRVVQSRESTFRETETKAELRMVTYDRHTKKCLSDLRVDDDTVTYVSGHARLMTPDRYVESLDQYLTCHKPGTVRNPMDSPGGPARERADIEMWYRLLDLGLVKVGGM